MQKKKHFPLFYVIYFSLTVLVIIGVQIAMQVVRGYLAEYESAQPQYEAQRIFAYYYEPQDYTELVALTSPAISDFETQNDLIQYLRTYTADKTITYSSITTGLDDTLKYIVKANDIKFSEFTMIKSGEKTEKGFDLYRADSFVLHTAGNESVCITAPRGYTVTLNGTALDERYLSGEPESHISQQHMPQGVAGIEFVTYTVNGLYTKPKSIAVTAPSGADAPLSEGNDGTLRAALVFSDSLASEYADYVIAAAEAISAYMQNDGRFSTASVYIDPDSAFYVNLRTSETYFVIDHSSFAFEDVKTSEFYPYDENTFSCRVSFTHVLRRYGSQDYKDYIDMTLYLRRVGDKFLIYDRVNH